MGKLKVLRGGKSLPSLKDLSGEFLKELASECKSPHTVRNYQADLAAFLRFYQGAAEGLDPGILRQYFLGFEGRAAATQARHRASVKSFLAWLVLNDYLAANPMDKLGTVKVPERQPRPVPDEDLAKLLKGIGNKRDRLLFTLIAETGLRISEALGIRVESIRLDAQEITVRGKGNRERTVYLVRTEALRLLRAYLRERGFKSGLLFRPDERKQRAGKTGEAIHYTTVHQAWLKICEAAGVKATIHQLRHAYATRLVNEGKPIEVVSKVLGHRRIATTQLYARVSDEAVKAALLDDGKLGRVSKARKVID